MPSSHHNYRDRCGKIWCRIHFTSIWYEDGAQHERYPLAFNVLSSLQGWREVRVYCGPGAYLPKKVHIPAGATA